MVCVCVNGVCVCEWCVCACCVGGILHCTASGQLFVLELLIYRHVIEQVYYICTHYHGNQHSEANRGSVDEISGIIGQRE